LAIRVVFTVTASTDSEPWILSYSTDDGANFTVFASGTGVSAYDPEVAAIEVDTDLSTLQVQLDCPSSKTIRIYELSTIGCYYTSPSASPSPGVWDESDGISTTWRNIPTNPLGFVQDGAYTEPPTDGGDTETGPSRSGVPDGAWTDPGDGWLPVM